MKKTLVFGASLKAHRPSNIAVSNLTSHGEDTVAFGPRSGEIGDIPVITELDGIGEVDTVSLYMNPVRQREYYTAILNLKPRRVIFNPGTENPEFYNLLVKDKIEFEEACTLTLLATGQY